MEPSQEEAESSQQLPHSQQTQQKPQQQPQSSQEEDEYNFIKSIIYGNQVKNSYGTFRAFCSAISSKDQIEKIIYYLKEKDNFKKYNKIVFAFRLFITPTFFVTQDAPKAEPKFSEGFQEDPTIEGSGEKLLHLLQKFNVENVLIVVGIEQYNPLSKFEATHFRVIVERAKDLLNNLYSRVVQSEIENLGDGQFIQNNLTSKPLRTRVKISKQIYHLPQLQHEPKFSRPQDRQNNRPNHIFFNSKPTFLKEKTYSLPPEQISRRKQIKELQEKLKQQAYQLEKILSSMDARDYLQLRFAIQYDQNKLTEKLLTIFMIICDVPTREILAYDFELKSGLESLTVNNLNDQKVKTISEMIRGDKRLTLDSVSKQNEALGPLFGFIQILVRSYDNGRLLHRLQEEERQFGLFTEYQKQVIMGITPEFPQSAGNPRTSQSQQNGVGTSPLDFYQGVAQKEHSSQSKMPEIASSQTNKQEGNNQESNYQGDSNINRQNNSRELEIKPNKMSLSSIKVFRK